VDSLSFHLVQISPVMSVASSSAVNRRITSEIERVAFIPVCFSKFCSARIFCTASANFGLSAFGSGFSSVFIVIPFSADRPQFIGRSFVRLPLAAAELRRPAVPAVVVRKLIRPLLPPLSRGAQVA
jgi:hypothetical protein